VIVIYDNTRPKAYFQANRFDAAKLAVGMPVIYRQDGRTWTGQITYKGRIASNVDFSGSASDSLLGGISSVSGLGSEPMIDLEMSIDGEDLTSLTLGFSLDAEIQTATADDVLLLPAESMKKELGEYYVFVVGTDSRLKRRVFKPGIQSDLFAEVREGLQPGEKVVLNPTNDLSDGMAVRVINDV
jgi:HlyD family secretion protein